MTDLKPKSICHTFLLSTLLVYKLSSKDEGVYGNKTKTSNFKINYKSDLVLIVRNRINLTPR